MEKNAPKQKVSHNFRQNEVGDKSNRAEPKLLPVVWAMLFTAMIIVDLLQVALDAVVIGFLANILIDVVVGPSLALFFYLRGMLDKKLTISLILGFALDWLSLGILPTWTADIAYAWLVTDGSKTIGKVTGAEETAKKISSKLLKK